MLLFFLTGEYLLLFVPFCLYCVITYPVSKIAVKIVSVKSISLDSGLFGWSCLFSVCGVDEHVPLFLP